MPTPGYIALIAIPAAGIFYAFAKDYKGDRSDLIRNGIFIILGISAFLYITQGYLPSSQDNDSLDEEYRKPTVETRWNCAVLFSGSSLLGIIAGSVLVTFLRKKD
jgi:hypothetical protein